MGIENQNISDDNIELLRVVNGTNICGTDIITTSTPTLIHTIASKNHSLAVSPANEKNHCSQAYVSVVKEILV